MRTVGSAHRGQTKTRAADFDSVAQFASCAGNYTFAEYYSYYSSGLPGI
jgi:hypothetical protein